MMASRLNHRGHVIPALTDHLEDKGRVIGHLNIRPPFGSRQSATRLFSGFSLLR
jgi:hypothetical protein